jgi:hypothetical protein
LKHIVTRIALVAILAMVAFPAGVAAQDDPPPIPEDLMTYLVLPAAAGILEAQADGTYQLTLSGLPDHMLNISDAPEFNVLRIPLTVLLAWAGAGDAPASVPAKLNLGDVLVDLTVTPQDYVPDAAVAVFGATIHAVIDPAAGQDKAEVPATFADANLVLQVDGATLAALAAAPVDESVRAQNYRCDWWCHLSAGTGTAIDYTACGCCWWVIAIMEVSGTYDYAEANCTAD